MTCWLIDFLWGAKLHRTYTRASVNIKVGLENYLRNIIFACPTQLSLVHNRVKGGVFVKKYSVLQSVWQVRTDGVRDQVLSWGICAWSSTRRCISLLGDIVCTINPEAPIILASVDQNMGPNWSCIWSSVWWWGIGPWIGRYSEDYLPIDSRSQSIHMK